MNFDAFNFRSCQPWGFFPTWLMVCLFVFAPAPARAQGRDEEVTALPRITLGVSFVEVLGVFSNRIPVGLGVARPGQFSNEPINPEWAAQVHAPFSAMAVSAEIHPEARRA
jgi:hypothetical protein